MEETRQRLRNRAEISRRKRTENRTQNIATGDASSFSEGSKSLLDDEDISIIEDDTLHHRHAFYNENDDSDGVEELGGLAGGPEAATVRQRRPQ